MKTTHTAKIEADDTREDWCVVFFVRHIDNQEYYIDLSCYLWTSTTLLSDVQNWTLRGQLPAHLCPVD